MDEAPAPPAPPASPPPEPTTIERAPVPPRVRRTLELVYAVEGVTAARVWQWPGRVSVGVRPSMLCAPSELLRRVEHAVSGLREPEETWDFGLLDTD
jgi:hypothetical protein